MKLGEQACKYLKEKVGLYFCNNPKVGIDEPIKPFCCNKEFCVYAEE